MTDSDMILPRWNGEYPRLSKNYKSKADLDAQPWGNIDKPQFFDANLDASLM